MGISFSNGFDNMLKYWAFDQIRIELARSAEIPPLYLMEGYFMPEEGPTLPILRGKLPISWTPFEDDPICYLLRQGDGEGRIPSRWCRVVASRIEDLLPGLHPYTVASCGGLVPKLSAADNIVEDAKCLAKGLVEAAESDSDFTWR